MTTKRTPIKRRRRQISRQQEIAAWSMLFETSHDFFDELAPLGFADDAAKYAAVEDAWHRLGPDFLDGWVSQTNRTVPWALERFGQPGGASKR